MNADVDIGGVIVLITGGEAILRREKREIGILVAREEVTITHARYSAGEQVAGAHVHHQHTDAFYILEGELTFEIGREADTITVFSGGFVAVPPEVAHSFRTTGDRPARSLTVHARPTAASPPSCEASGTVSKSTGTSPQSAATADAPPPKRSSARGPLQRERQGRRKKSPAELSVDVRGIDRRLLRRPPTRASSPAVEVAGAGSRGIRAGWRSVPLPVRTETLVMGRFPICPRSDLRSGWPGLPVAGITGCDRRRAVFSGRFACRICAGCEQAGGRLRPDGATKDADLQVL